MAGERARITQRREWAAGEQRQVSSLDGVAGVLADVERKMGALTSELDRCPACCIPKSWKT